MFEHVKQNHQENILFKSSIVAVLVHFLTNCLLLSFNLLGIGGSPTLQIILDLCIPEIELANTRSQISYKFFQSHS